MKILLLSFVFILSIRTISAQDNMKVENFFLVEVLPAYSENQEKMKVPQGEIWRIESALCELGTLHVSLVINDHSYIIALQDQSLHIPSRLPFYLPAGTEFQLHSESGNGIVCFSVISIASP